MKRFIMALTALLLLASCGGEIPEFVIEPDYYDWCYTFNFTSSDYGITIVSGDHVPTLGFQNDIGTGALTLAYVHNQLVQPSAMRSTFYVDVAGGGSNVVIDLNVFDAITSYNQVNIPYDAGFTLDLPAQYANASNTMSLALAADNAVVTLIDLTLYGDGANPFPTNGCEAELTATSTPFVLPSPTALPTNTPTNSPTPTVTNTPTNTPTPTITNTPPPYSNSYTFPFNSNLENYTYVNVSGADRGAWSSSAYGESGTIYGTAIPAAGNKLGWGILLDLSQLPSGYTITQVTIHYWSDYDSILYIIDENGYPFRSQTIGVTSAWVNHSFSSLSWTDDQLRIEHHSQSTVYNVYVDYITVYFTAPDPTDVPTSTGTQNPTATPNATETLQTATQSAQQTAIQQQTQQSYTSTPRPTSTLYSTPITIPTATPSGGGGDNGYTGEGTCENYTGNEANDTIDGGWFEWLFGGVDNLVNCVIMPPVNFIKDAVNYIRGAVTDALGYLADGVNNSLRFGWGIFNYTRWGFSTITGFFGWGFNQALPYAFAWTGNLFQLLLYLASALIFGLVAAAQAIYSLIISVISFAISFFNTLTSFIWTAINLTTDLIALWNNAPATKPDGLPDCINAPTDYDICALYYVSEYTIFSGIGVAILPLLVTYIDLIIFMSFAKRIKEVLLLLRESFRK